MESLKPWHCLESPVSFENDCSFCRSFVHGQTQFLGQVSVLVGALEYLLVGEYNQGEKSRTSEWNSNWER